MTYTSTGVRPPCVSEQQTAPARANLEYKSNPVGAAPVEPFNPAFALWIAPSIFVEPVDVAVEAIVYVE